MKKAFYHLFLTIPLVLLSFLMLLIALSWFLNSVYTYFNPPKKIEYGITFSSLQAERLGFTAETVYSEILDDLQVKMIRLPVYWNSVEAAPGKFDFQTYDQLLELSQAHKTQIILAVGYKSPRWPECFPPPWVGSDQKQLQQETLNFLRTSINHFKNRPEIVAWQVENEPFFPFGNCQRFDRAFLLQEISLVRSLDQRPIILTDSGEFGLWGQLTNYTDIFGTTLYRMAWNSQLGYLRYPFPPFYYQLKALLIQPKEVFVSELQAEPWEPGTTTIKTPIETQVRVFSLKDFQTEIRFAAQTGISKQYLWGAEWWYFMKEQGHPEYWNYARQLFQQ